MWGVGCRDNLAHFLEYGATSVTGIDIDYTQIHQTSLIFLRRYPQHKSSIQFVLSDAAKMPFPDEYFDILVANDTFEHVNNLPNTLHECARVLRPGGRLYVYFPPFYAPWGTHMVNWIHIPWCQVAFSEKTILNVARQLEKDGKSINSRLPKETQLNLGESDRIPFVSHLTLKYFRNVLIETPSLQIENMKLLPPGWRKHKRINQILSPLTHIPIVQEMFTAKAVYILRKI